MYLGAAIGNSHPISYAQADEHPLLSRDAIVAAQDVLQTTLGKGLGMVVCRSALLSVNAVGQPAVELAALGRLFLLVMLLQALILLVGYDPQTALDYGRCLLSTHSRGRTVPRHARTPSGEHATGLGARGLRP